MFNVVSVDMPTNKVSLIKSHPQVKNLFEIKKILRPWMEREDRLQVLESRKTRDGLWLTPVLIIPMEGEPCDVFGHWITDEPPH